VQLAQAADSTRTITTTAKFGGWTVTCNQAGEAAAKVCSANFRVVTKENNANILVWVIGFNAKGALLSEFLTLTEVQIQPGVGVTLDDATTLKADFVECGVKGCKARLEMSPSIVRSMKAATKATIAMTRLDGQVLQFQMEIPGIGEAMAELGV
jgi:invasion protein IalB